MDSDPTDPIAELRVALQAHAEALERLQAAVDRRAARFVSLPVDASLLRRHTAELQAAADALQDASGPEPESAEALDPPLAQEEP